jgi:hypothetical protein
MDIIVMLQHIYVYILTTLLDTHQTPWYVNDDVLYVCTYVWVDIRCNYYVCMCLAPCDSSNYMLSM